MPQKARNGKSIMAGNPNTPRNCAGTQATLPSQCQCSDPGVVASGQDVIVADSNLCPRRLLPVRDVSGNVVGGFIVYAGTGQQESVISTNQPSVPVPGVAVAAAQSFGSLLLCTGTAGLFQTLNPPATSNLFLQTDGAGGLELAAPPIASVPDPLTIGTINVNTLLNVTGNMDLTGVLNSAVAAGTITRLLGLDVSNNMVSGTVSLISKALWYESSPLYSATPSYPNTSLLTGSPFIAGYINDVDGITAYVSPGTALSVVGNGTYQIDWRGSFVYGNNSSICDLGLTLLINGAPANYGVQGAVQQGRSGGNNQATAVVSGSHIQQLNAGTTISLSIRASQLNSSAAPGTGYNLRGVEIIITKFK